MQNKSIFRFIVLAVIFLILFFQLRKRNDDISLIHEKENLIKKANSPYTKLLFQLPVYRDSVYKVYIANIEGANKIIFLKKDVISEKQKESNFFLHLYPQNKKLLGDNEFGNLAFDFKNNVRSFIFDDSIYYISDTNLPAFKIYTGQYGYNGNNDINWSVSEILNRESISKILHFNKEKIKEFE